MVSKIDRQAFLQSLIVPPGKEISLHKDYDPGFKPDYITKEDATLLLQQGIEKMAEFQDKLYAQDTYALLINLQAMDAAGKDGTIRHVMSGLNPQGCQVFSFKVPSAEELDHDYLWRYYKALPERGRIGIFNRSYYEELLVVRVHQNLLERQKLPPEDRTKKVWQRRFEEINNFEKYLVNNGVIVLKFFLNVSKGEQKKRFLERIDRPEKNWKFSENDVKERAFWETELITTVKSFVVQNDSFSCPMLVNLIKHICTKRTESQKNWSKNVLKNILRLLEFYTFTFNTLCLLMLS